jgi:hypothetical protein
MCAPRDQRESNGNQRQHAELNALRFQRRADVSRGSDLVRQAANFALATSIRIMDGYGTTEKLREPVPVGNLVWLAVDRESGDAVVQ